MALQLLAKQRPAVPPPPPPHAHARRFTSALSWPQASGEDFKTIVKSGTLTITGPSPAITVRSGPLAPIPAHVSAGSTIGMRAGLCYLHPPSRFLGVAAEAEGIYLTYVPSSFPRP
jgi:hypothetical protein